MLTLIIHIKNVWPCEVLFCFQERKIYIHNNPLTNNSLWMLKQILIFVYLIPLYIYLTIDPNFTAILKDLWDSSVCRKLGCCGEERLKRKQKKRDGQKELQSKSLRESDQTYCLLSCWEKRRSKEMEKHDGGKEAKNAKWTTELLLAAQTQHPC